MHFNWRNTAHRDPRSACASSIARVIFLVRSVDGPVDTTYDTVQPLIWSIIEPCTGIICACLPILRPLIQICSSKLSNLVHLLSSAIRTPSGTRGASAAATSPSLLPGKLPSWSPAMSDTTDSWGRQASIDTDGFEFLRPNRMTLAEQIRISHASWLISESQEDLARVYQPRGRNGNRFDVCDLE